jgi:HAD superfamily hydrolase (TIGR01459 family)
VFAPASADPAARAGTPRLHSGMSRLMEDIDGFIIDQWGVLHDGYVPYDGAVDCLQRIRAAGKGVVILSNSGKRAGENIQLLERLGFARHLFDAVISAGDDARDAILHPPDPFYRNLGVRCLVMTRAEDLHLADGLGRQLVADVEEADFLLVLSIDALRQSVAGWEPVLVRAAARGLPMVCGNPDFVRTAPGGQLFEAPGLLARRYAELGGTVRLHGKPSARIYAACLRALPYPRERIAAVGDSLHHDVLGATGVGLRSVFIAGGVHRNELGIAVGDSPDPERCAQLYAQAGVVPDVLVPMFRW